MADYRSAMAVLRHQDEAVAKYLENIPLDQWCTAAAGEQGYSLFGISTNNACEQFNAYLLQEGLRNQSPPDFFRKCLTDTRRIAMEIVAAVDGETYCILGSSLDDYHKRTSSYTYFTAERQSDNICIVRDKGSKEFKVCIEKGKISCDCNLMQQEHVPCVHFVSAVVDANIARDWGWLTASFHKSHRVRDLKAALSNVRADPMAPSV
jgi:hypothetical protein